MIIIWFRAFVHFVKKEPSFACNFFCLFSLFTLLLFSSGSKFIKYSTPSVPKQKQISAAAYFLFVLCFHLLLCYVLCTQLTWSLLFAFASFLYPPSSIVSQLCVCLLVLCVSVCSKRFSASKLLFVWVRVCFCMSECVLLLTPSDWFTFQSECGSQLIASGLQAYWKVLLFLGGDFITPEFLVIV